VVKVGKIADAYNTKVAIVHRKLNLFNSWKQICLTTKRLAGLHEQVTALHSTHCQREIFTTWRKRACAFKTAHKKADRKTQGTILKAFKCLKLAVHRRKAGVYAHLWHLEYLKRVFVSTLQRVTKRRQYNTECV